MDLGMDLNPDRGGRRSFGEPRAGHPRRSFARDDVANLIICILADYTERRSQGSRRGGCSARTPFTFQLRILCASVDEPIGGTVQSPQAKSFPATDRLSPPPQSKRINKDF